MGVTVAADQAGATTPDSMPAPVPDEPGTLFGDLGGLRPFLDRYGLSFSLQETSEVLGNLTGGTRQGFDYDGLTQMALALDTESAFGWRGGTATASALQIHGRNLSTDNLDTLQTTSGIEADRATRLWELWYQQKFGTGDGLDVRFGEQSLDQEFMVSDNALLFVNTMFGWPMLPSADLPGGGPAYPLSAPGIRIRAHPAPALTLLAGVFSGSPLSTDRPGDPQRLNASGTSFPWNGTLVIAELQFANPAPDKTRDASAPATLARSYKLGAWYDTKRFADQEIDTFGRSLADPASTGIPRTHRGDWAIYAVADQVVWADPHNVDRTISLFIRPMGTPLGDRNLIDFSLNAGITVHAPFLRRSDDVFGLGMGYAHVSGRAAALDRDMERFAGAFVPARTGEAYIEATYRFQAAPWWQIQPDIQGVFNPGGGIANAGGTGKIGDELVLGLRTNIVF